MKLGKASFVLKSGVCRNDSIDIELMSDGKWKLTTNEQGAVLTTTDIAGLYNILIKINEFNKV